MSQSLVAEDEDVRQSCFTKSAEEPPLFTQDFAVTQNRPSVTQTPPV